MKVLVVAHNSDFSGGANRSLYMVIDRLRRDYCVDIRVLVPKKKGALVNKLEADGIMWDNVPYYGVMTGLHDDRKDIIRKLKVWIGYFWERWQGKKLAVRYKHEGVDVVYTNTRLPYIGAVIAKKLEVPHICHVREFGAIKPYWPKWNYQDIYDNSDKIILISQALCNEFKKHVLPDKLVAIHNGIDSPLNLPMTNYGEHKGFHLLLTGRLVIDKGHMDAIKAIKILEKMGYNDIYLHFAGSVLNSTFNSEYIKEIRKLIEQEEISNKIFFHGEVSNMTELRMQCDCELMCAVCETFGRVTVEGMRSGLLLIGSNTGGTVEIITDGITGLLYEQGNAKSLADKIEFAHNQRHEAKEIAKAGYEFAQNNFTPDINVKQIYEVMHSVCSK